jgi:hypothetical protein
MRCRSSPVGPIIISGVRMVCDIDGTIVGLPPPLSYIDIIGEPVVDIDVVAVGTAACATEPVIPIDANSAGIMPMPMLIGAKPRIPPNENPSCDAIEMLGSTAPCIAYPCGTPVDMPPPIIDAPIPPPISSIEGMPPSEPPIGTDAAAGM